MKTLTTLLLSLIFCNLFAQEIQEKEVKTEVNEVTVFLNGAQIIRQSAVSLPKGATIIRFTNLSPFIDAKSIRVKAEGELTVLSVNHQQNYLEKSAKPAELTGLENQLETVEEKIKTEMAYLSVIKEEIIFLKDNRIIGGKNEQVSVAGLEQASGFYNNKMTSLKLKEIEREKTLAALNSQKNDLLGQIKSATGKKEFPTGEIIVKAEAKLAKTYPIELSYLVGNAGWFPSYDIRAESIHAPVQLVYKANVKQDTKADWKNVRLKFSSANPNVSGVAPELRPYYLDYNILPPVYNMVSDIVHGKVTDSNGEPIPAVTVNVEGTTIGTVTDADGRYSITVPGPSARLVYSFIGFDQLVLPVSGDVANVVLQEDKIALDEVVVTGYGSNDSGTESLMKTMPGVASDKPAMKVKAPRSLPVATVQVENQTTVEFEIKTPYTVCSDNKNYTVEMAISDLPAFYQYFCVPKIDRDAFLIANIADWEKYSLLEGEANIFFEDTYVGKTLLDVRYASDTLKISLGRDKKVSVSREKVKDFTGRQLIGNKKEETRVWKTTLRNNKNEEINLVLLDQAPVSENEEIEVNVQNLSGGKMDPETGEIKWEFQLNPGIPKEVELKYSVKYPKYRNLPVE